MNVLNPRLYAALERKYGEVGIVNPGEPARVTRRPSYRLGKARWNVQVDGGEAYKVRCQFCRDWRQRLQFNHLWGTRDNPSGQQLLHLAICFNEDCLADWDRRRHLYESLMTGLRRRRRRGAAPPAAIAAPAAAHSLPRKIKLPDGCIPVNELGHDHPARTYLESRDFEVDELWKHWRVQYCDQDSQSCPPIYSRIVVPIYRQKDRFAANAAELPIGNWLVGRPGR